MNVRGKILRLPRVNGVIVVPYQEDAEGWYCVVVRGAKNIVAGGYNILCTHEDLAEVEEVPLFLDGQVRY